MDYTSLASFYPKLIPSKLEGVVLLLLILYLLCILIPHPIGNVVIDGKGDGKGGALETATRQREKQSSREQRQQRGGRGSIEGTKAAGDRSKETE